MFQNKKIKALENRNVELASYVAELKTELSKRDKEVKSLQDFNKKIDDKIEELCKPKIDAFCLSLVESGVCVSSTTFNSTISIANEKCESLEELLTSQAKKIEELETKEEDTKKILFLAGKVEQLLNQLKKGK